MSLLKLIVPLVLAGAIAQQAVAHGAVAHGALAETATADRAATHGAPASAHSLLQSRELWATVDMCNPKDKPNWIGIRGSMPSDGQPKDIMYMRLRVQYLDPVKKEWLNISKGGDTGLLKLGAGLLPRQGGLSVELAPAAGKPAFTLRGYVVYQWRKGSTVVQSATRLTTAGHTTSLAGSDPKGFSAATCKLA